MNSVGVNHLYLTTEQQRLLGGWLDVLDDIRHLCRSLKALPDGCTCSNGSAHLSGSCVCCQTTHTDRVPGCANCDLLLARLRPDIDALTVDTLRFFPAFKDVIVRSNRPDAAQAEAAAIERRIAAVAWTFEQLIVAADEFRVGCRASHLRTLKERATGLLAEVNGFDRSLRGPDDHL